jgi:hypothetical protein
MISVQRQGILYEINLALSSTLDLHAVLDVLVQKIKILLPYSAATITLLNKEIGTFEPIACWNMDEHEWKSSAIVSGGGKPHGNSGQNVSAQNRSGEGIVGGSGRSMPSGNAYGRGIVSGSGQAAGGNSGITTAGGHGNSGQAKGHSK